MVVSLIVSVTTSGGLCVVCQRDDAVYKVAQAVSDEDFMYIALSCIEPFGDWNYILN